MSSEVDHALGERPGPGRQHGARTGPSWSVTVSVAFSATLRPSTRPWSVPVLAGRSRCPASQRVRHAAGPHRPAAHRDPAAGRLAQADQGLAERRVAAGRRPRPGRAPRRGAPSRSSGVERAVQGEPFGAQHRLAGRRPAATARRGGVPGGRPAAPPRRSSPRPGPPWRRSATGRGEHVPGVAVDGDGGAEVVDLLQVVRDEQEGDALPLQFAQLGRRAGRCRPRRAARSARRG